MNKFKKMLVKNDFFKAVEGYSDDWDNISLHYYQADVGHLNNKIEKALTFCLSTILDCDITIKPKLSDEGRILFIVDDVYDEFYELTDGTVKPIGIAYNLSLIIKVRNLGESLGLISDAYDKIMEKYKTEVVPITERVNFCYNFHECYYYVLKNKRDMDKEIKIFTSHSSYPQDSHVDTDEYCYFSWEDLEALDRSIRIDPSYSACLNMLESSIDEIIDKLKEDLGIVKCQDKCEKEQIEHSFISFDAEESEEVPRLLIREDNLFTYVEGVRCVREEWKRHLRYLDLANVSFNGVYIAGLDFTGSNAIIDPKLVYNRDISNCIFDKNNLVGDVDSLDDCIINDDNLCIECGRPIKR